jgi:hypothetical protein
MATQQNGGEEEAGGIEAILASLEASGIDIMGAIMSASSILMELSGLEFSVENVDALLAIITEGIIPLISYLELQGVNPFEVIDQLMGFSGGVEGIDPEVRDNTNTSLAFDLLAEGGVSITELIMLLDVNISIVVQSISD